MKKLILLLAVVLPILGLCQFKPPDKLPNTYVFDYDHRLPQQGIDTLNSKLLKFRDVSSIQFAVVIVPSLNDDDIEDAANAIFRKWGIGTKELNNGLLYLICPAEHEARIEVGLGLEGDLTDYQAERIQEVEKDFFRAGQWYAGISAVVDSTISTLKPISWAQRAALQKKREAEHEEAMARLGNSLLLVLYVMLAVAAVILLVLCIVRHNQKIKFKKALEEADKKADEYRKAQVKVYDEQSRKNLRSVYKLAETNLEQELRKYEETKNSISQYEFAKYINITEPDVKQLRSLLADALVKATKLLQNNSSSTNDVVRLYDTIVSIIDRAGHPRHDIEGQIYKLNGKIKYVKDLKKILPSLYAQAKKEISNIPYKDIRQNDYDKIMSDTGNPLAVYATAVDVEDTYNKIISYRAKQAQLARQKAEEEQEAVIRRRQNEEEVRRRRDDDSYRSSSSSDYGSSSSSGSDFSFGGGTSGGGGANSSW